MSDEITIEGGVVHVTDANIIGHSRHNRIKARNDQRSMSVHYRTDGVRAPGPREALLVTILSGVPLPWLQVSAGPEEPGPVDIDFTAESTEKFGSEYMGSSAKDGQRPKQHDFIRMTEVARGDTTRLHMAMTSPGAAVVHGIVVLNKRQVTQMIASLLVLYPRLHED